MKKNISNKYDFKKFEERKKKIENLLVFYINFDFFFFYVYTYAFRS